MKTVIEHLNQIHHTPTRERAINNVCRKVKDHKVSKLSVSLDYKKSV